MPSCSLRAANMTRLDGFILVQWAQSDGCLGSGWLVRFVDRRGLCG